jgi:uncharacterized protein YkwD
MQTAPATPSTHRGTLKRLVVAAIAVAAIGVAADGPLASPVEAGGVSSSDWLGVVNAYRSQSGLSPVTENPTWSSGALSHSCWMLLNGIAHDEAPGTAGYTTAGDEAGNNGNVAVSSNGNATARSHIDLWMTGPFHAIGLLRSSLTQTGFGLCSSPPNPTATSWKSAGTLDVVRGNNWGAPKPASPVVFPGNGATTSLTRFVAESPDPRTFCDWGGNSVGLPLIALMPSAVSAANATLAGPNGPIPTCVLHKGNTNGTASAILGGDNAVVVLPASPLVAGNYSVTVGSNGGNASWSFTVDPNAELGAGSTQPAPPAPLATTDALTSGDPFQPVTPFRFADSRLPRVIFRLAANKLVRVPVAGQQGLPADITSVSANFTAAGAATGGYLTASNCAEANPSFSTLNFEAYGGVPNQAIIPLDRGALCLFSSAETDVIIDINGYVSPGATQWFNPVIPQRLLDTRLSQPLRAGQVLRVDVEGGASPAPDAAVAVAVNLTGVLPDQNGWVRAFPCDVAEPEVSSMNPQVGLAKANSAIIPTAADGTICLTSDITTDIIIDITGWFGPQGGLEFVPLTPLRLTDTRQVHPDLNGGSGPRFVEPGEVFRVQIAGNRGVTSAAKAATLNLVAAGGPAAGYLTVVPCGGGSQVSNLNYPGLGAVANGATVMLDSQGSVCVTTSAPTYLIIDITGVWI